MIRTRKSKARPKVNLLKFCGNPLGMSRYDIEKPWLTPEGYCAATNGMIAVRCKKENCANKPKPPGSRHVPDIDDFLRCASGVRKWRKLPGIKSLGRCRCGDAKSCECTVRIGGLSVYRQACLLALSLPGTLLFGRARGVSEMFVKHAFGEAVLVQKY